MDRPRFCAYFQHPRFWLLWLGLGLGLGLALLWMIVQLPYRLLLALGRALGALMHRLVGSRRQIAARNLDATAIEREDVRASSSATRFSGRQRGGRWPVDQSVGRAGDRGLSRAVAVEPSCFKTRPPGEPKLYRRGHASL